MLSINTAVPTKSYTLKTKIILNYIPKIITYRAVNTLRDNIYPVRMSEVGCHCTMIHDQWLLLQFLVLLMMDAESVRNMQSNLAVTNKRYCQSRILLVPYIIQTYDARKLKHKKIQISFFMKIFYFIGYVLPD